MKLTPEILEAVYDFLRATPPFRGWKLPKGEDVIFHVTKTRGTLGSYTRYIRTDRHIINISGARISHTALLACVMAHEMVHLNLGVRKAETPNTEHSAEFRRLSKIVCRHHGFDPLDF